MVQDMVNSAKPKMEAALSHFQSEMKNIRAGRASAQMLDSVVISYYGTPTPLKGLATITTPDAAQILIQPFDVAIVKEINNAISLSDLGFNPSDDGRVVRINVPPLTADRREELVKKIGKTAEAARVSVRAVRGDVWEEIQKSQKDGVISEDNRDWGRAEIDKLTAEYNKKIEQMTKDKEVEIRTV
jgi:ribosome recycling factor